MVVLEGPPSQDSFLAPPSTTTTYLPSPQPSDMASSLPSISFPTLRPPYNPHPPHPLPPHPGVPMAIPRLSDEELNIKPRPHPHLPSSTIFVDHIPPDVEETIFVKALRECMPMRIKLNQPVPLNVRLQPDAYYQWMPKSGSLVFDDMYHVEKAMAILSNHPLVYSRGITVSTYQHPAFLPLGQATGRYIRPKKQVLALSTPSPDPTDQFMQQCPTPGELFDAVRSWGSVRSLGVWMEQPNPEGPSMWGARVEFWYEDEARRFEIGLGQRAIHIKGWQVEVYPELVLPPPQNVYTPAAYPPYPHAPHPPAHTMPPVTESYDYPPMDLPLDYPPPPPHHSQNQLNLMYQPIHNMPFLPELIVPSTPAGRGNRFRKQAMFPQTPPPLNYNPPWVTHNPYTVSGVDYPPQMPQLPLSPPQTAHFGLPSTPGTPASTNGVKSHTRHRSNSSRASISSLRHSRQRTWSVTIDEGPMGEIRPTGLVADDGTVIQHGPGQHIRPAPPFGPGSTSSSGLVDYSNVFVKNLDPDVNSVFLTEFFSPVGRIISARVMRDEQNRSRGYGFVSFHTPEEVASAAISMMNGQKLGKQLIAVTLHEPRKLRPEKIAERMAMGAPTAYGRQGFGTRRSSSPTRNERRYRNSFEDPRSPGTTDGIRLLSPKSRKVVLSERVTPGVTHYARVNSIPKEHCQTTINALVNLDLQLIPLLHNAQALEAKISETISVLQSDPDFNVNLDRNTQFDPQRKLLPTEGEIDKLREEILRIDPLSGDAVMKLLLKDLQRADIQSCLQSKTALVQKYNSAKKEIISREEKKGEKIRPEEIPLPLSDPPTGTPTPFQRLASEDATLPDLVTLRTRDVLGNLEGDEGDSLLTQLGISRPTQHEQASIETWTRRVMEKSGVERKTDMAAMLARKLDASMKRSQKLKIARDIVNEETDDEALCLLMAYPAFLEAKVRDFDAGKT